LQPCHSPPAHHFHFVEHCLVPRGQFGRPLSSQGLEAPWSTLRYPKDPQRPPGCYFSFWVFRQGPSHWNIVTSVYVFDNLCVAAVVGVCFRWNIGALMVPNSFNITDIQECIVRQKLGSLAQSLQSLPSGENWRVWAVVCDWNWFSSQIPSIPSTSGENHHHVFMFSSVSQVCSKFAFTWWWKVQCWWVRIPAHPTQSCIT
jgi:hypothetical protein